MVKIEHSEALTFVFLGFSPKLLVLCALQLFFSPIFLLDFFLRLRFDVIVMIRPTKMVIVYTMQVMDDLNKLS